MKRFIGLAAMAAVALAGFVLPAQGALIFIDDFADPAVANSSPAPGQPGGGEIGGTGFWSSFISGSSPGHPAGSLAISNGSIHYVTPSHLTDSSISARIWSGIHPELSFVNQPAGVMLTVSDIVMDWGGTGVFEIGFSSGENTIIHSCSNVLSIAINASGTLRRRVKETTQTQGWTEIPGLTDAPITDFSLYMDDTHYFYLVKYTNGASGMSDILTHGFTPTSWSNVNIHLSLRAGVTGVNSWASIGGVTVIPEPGTLTLALGSIGAALFLRRRRLAA